MDDFCVFILTHRRPERVITYRSLREAGYTGKIYLLLDDEDPTIGQYREIFPQEEVLTFSKVEAATLFDVGDNFPGRKGVVYARNACWGVARRVGIKYFVQLDDDYSGYYYRFNSAGNYGVSRIKTTMDDLFSALVEYLRATPILTIALSQGGDHIGGANGNGSIRLRRKAMNSFVCATDRPFKFLGRINEDTTAYVALAATGGLFFTVMQAQLNQLQTQSNPGGLTEIYLDAGTYVKSFYTVMFAPSCTRVGELGDPRSPHRRLHHAINWNRAAPCILREAVKRSADT